MTKAFYYPADNDEETNHKYFDLVNRKQMLTDEIIKKSSWNILAIFPLKMKLKAAKREIHEFEWKHGDVVHVDILEL